MECEYHKYGCSSKLANTDHLQLHLQVQVHQHLKQVVVLLDKEIDKNKSLSTSLDSLQSRLTQLENHPQAPAPASAPETTSTKSNIVLDIKVKELETKLQALQGLFDKYALTSISNEPKLNGTSTPSPSPSPTPNGEDSHLKGLPQQKFELKSRFSSTGTRNTVEKQQQEDSRIKEEKAREDKAKEEKAKEEKMKEESNKAKMIMERGRSKTDEEVRRPDSRQEQIAAANNNISSSNNTSNNASNSISNSGSLSGSKIAQSVPQNPNPPPFIVKSSSGDMEPQERKHNNMSLREEPRYSTKQPQPAPKVNNMYDRSRAKTWSNSNRKKEEGPDITIIPADAPLETGIIWEYDSIVDEWCRGVVTFRMTKSHFAEGALRTAHMMEIHGEAKPAGGYDVEKNVGNGKTFNSEALPIMGLLGDKYVVKLSKARVPIDRYFEDVKMQQICVELAKKFNQQGTPKKVEFLTAWVLEIPKPNGSGSMWCGLEHYIGGEFKKLSNNHGGVLEPRNTPQAFSHFTWEHTKHNLIVVDLQGVDDDYTDPQIHTKDGNGYGVGNLGKTGIDRFLKTHQCNAICQMLNLPLINALNTKSAMQKLIKGTQQVPFIDDQLGNVAYPRLEVGENISSGEFNCMQTLTGHVDRVVSLCVTPKNLFSGSSDGSLRVWSLPGLTFDRELNVHRKSVESICANDQYLFTGSADHSIKVWDLSNFALVIALRDHVGEVNAIALTDKSLNYLISASFDKNIKVWSLRTFKCVQTLTGHSKCVKALAVSGSILFSGSNDGSVYMWSLKNLTCLFALDAHEGWVKSLVVKDKTLYSGSFDCQVKEWKVTSFQNGDTLGDHNDNVNSLCLTDRYLISGSDDKTAMIWDMVTRKVVAVLKGHRLGVQAVVTDGKFIYTASDDSSIKVWKWFG